MIVSHAARSLRRGGAFSALAIVVLGVGVGAVASAWTLTDRLLLEPLPVRDQARLVVAWSDEPVRGFDHYPFTGPAFVSVSSGAVPALDGVAAVGSWGVGDTVVEEDEGLTTQRWASVLGDFFGVLGVEPLLGRTLVATDDVPSPSVRAAVISEALWTARYGRAESALGSILRTRRGDWTIVGVLPGSFEYPMGADVWTPTKPRYPQWDAEPPLLELDLVGRLAPGASIEQVQEQINAAMRATPDLARVYENATPVIRPFAEVVLGPVRPVVLLLLAGALLVLLVAILDVTNLSLVRQVERRAAWAVRSALGAQPGRLILEASAEAGLIAIFAAIVGAGVARVALGLLAPLAPVDLPRVTQLGQSGLVVLGTSAVIAALGAALSIVLPVWRATRVMPGSALYGGRGAAGSTTGARLRQGITAVQVGLTVWVLVMGVLMSRTVSNLRSLDLGFAAENLVLVGLDYVGDGVEAPPGLADQLLRATARIRATPQVMATSPLQMPPLPGNAAWQTILFRQEQTREQAVDENPFLFMEFVESDFFNALDAPVVRGRGFTEGDGPGSIPVLLLNESAARLYYPGEAALGQRVNVRFPGSEDVPSEIVGVVGDTRYGDLTEIKPTVYFPIRQVDAFHSRYILVRTDGTPLEVRSVVRDALAAEAPDFRPMSVAPVQTLLDAPLVRPRFAATIVGILAALALFLAAIGMYGVMTFYVRSRRPDIGVRLACGATPGQARGLVIRSGLMLGGIGGIGGVLAALGTGSVIESLLFGVAPTDPLSLGLSLALGMLGAFAACVLPARRAAEIDPAQLLRSE